MEDLEACTTTSKRYDMGRCFGMYLLWIKCTTFITYLVNSFLNEFTLINFVIICFSLQISYDLSPTDEMKKYCLSEVHSKWKDFKYILTKDYIRGKKQGKDPCQEYTIPAADWSAFVASRQDPDFLVNIFYPLP